jgi:predicted ABC-type transport system involved in lysophospholipase L1 biosynthesis ATPase subunit
LLEETQQFDVGVARRGSRDRLARHLLEGGEQRDRAMADVMTILPKSICRDEPIHLLIDSTGLKIYGEGEWLDQ